MKGFARVFDFSVQLLEVFVVFDLVELRIFQKSLGVSDVLLDRCYQRFQALKVLLRPQISDDANFQ